MPHPLFERHAATIERALTAIGERGYWSPYSESPSPKVYGEGAAEAGKAAFDALLGKPFALDAAGHRRHRGPRSLAVRHSARHHAIPRPISTRCSRPIGAAEREWRKAGPEAWVGVSAEILHRINRRASSSPTP